MDTVCDWALLVICLMSPVEQVGGEHWKYGVDYNWTSGCEISPLVLPPSCCESDLSLDLFKSRKTIV